jgi:hypothetical protein
VKPLTTSAPLSLHFKIEIFEAPKSKDFATADRIRDDLAARGICLKMVQAEQLGGLGKVKHLK